MSEFLQFLEVLQKKNRTLLQNFIIFVNMNFKKCFTFVQKL